MYDYQKQFDRVKRYLVKIENQNRSEVEYEDDLWAFFQNAWHLKDWIKNDDMVDNTKFDVEETLKSYYSLQVCADMCNRTKHLKLTSKRVGAKGKGRNIVMVITEPVNISGDNEADEGTFEISYNHVLVDDSGNESKAIQIAKDAVRDWTEIISTVVVLNHKS